MDVNEHGVFSATFQGEFFSAESLDRLHYQLRDALMAARVEVPFVSPSGRKGVMRGYHGGTRELLVTWEDGEKGRFHPTSHVFRATVPQEKIDRLRVLHEQAEKASREIREITRGDGGLEIAVEIFNEVFGSDVTKQEQGEVAQAS